jgi:hypothetical protein
LKIRHFGLALLIVILMTNAANAFKIKPIVTEADGTVIEVESTGRFWDRFYPIFADMFTHPVHESITNQIYGCTDDDELCGEANGNYAPEAVLAGARWNDNPPFKLESGGEKISCPLNTTIKLPRQSKCWYGLFKDAEKHANETSYDAKSGKVILYRIHFGDMQFVHSMASRDNEPAQKTRDDIMMWAEFTYKVAHGDIERGTAMDATGINRLDKLLAGKGLTVQMLFVRGDGDLQNDESVQQFAFGSLLHMIEDSFSPAHTDRNDPPGTQCPGNFDQPGKIKSFHSYVNQDKRLHSKMDVYKAVERDKVESGANVVYVGKALKSLYDSKKSWEEVRPFIECLYDMENPAALSGPGLEFEK